MLRDVGFSLTKIQMQSNIKLRSNAQYAYKRYLKINRFEAQKSSGRPPKLSKRSEKKLVNYRCYETSQNLNGAHLSGS